MGGRSEWTRSGPGWSLRERRRKDSDLHATCPHAHPQAEGLIRYKRYRTHMDQSEQSLREQRMWRISAPTGQNHRKINIFNGHKPSQD